MGEGAASIRKLLDTRVQSFDEVFVVKDPDGFPVAGRRYVIKRADGSIEEGVTDELGQTHVVMTAEAEKLELHVLKDLAK